MSKELLTEVIREGAVKLESRVGPHELNRLRMLKPLNIETMKVYAPTVGGLLVGLLNETSNSGRLILSHETLGKHMLQEVPLHTDSTFKKGISCLIPLTGGAADFYYANEPLVMPSDAPLAHHFSYEPGDVAVIRQEIEFQTVTGLQYAPQVYHAGLSDGARDVLICDIYFNNTLCLDDSRFTEAVS